MRAGRDGTSATSPGGAGRPAAGLVVVSTIALWISTGIASAALWPIYESAALPLLVAVATAAGSAIAILGALHRWPSLAVMTATVVAYFALGVALAIPGRAVLGILPSPEGLAELATGAATSWKQLLTISLPVGGYQSLLIPAFILILLTVVTALSVALRTEYGEWAVLGPLTVFLVGILFGPDHAPWPFPLAMGLTASVLLWLVWRRWYRRRESIRRLPQSELAAAREARGPFRDGGFTGLRALLGAGTILAIAAVAAYGASGALPPAGERVVLRTSMAQPFDPRDYPSPLSGFRRYQQDGLRQRAVMTVTGLPADGRIRIATLDTYDGIVYSVGSGSLSSASGSFTRVPLSVDQSGVSGTRTTIGITIGDYSGVWLPTVGSLESVRFEGEDAASLLGSFYYNDNSDTAAVIGGLAPGDRYSLTAILPRQPTEAELSSLRPGGATLPPLTVVPDALAAVLDGYVAGVTEPGARLVAMLEGLRRDGYVSHGVSATEPASRSGHAADRITELLTTQRMIGDQEQYAVTAAVMARQLGFPARVVFGFAPPASASPGPITVVGADVSAWIEVDTTAYGWVAIDPTPAPRAIPEEQPEEPAQVARPQSPVQPDLPEAESRDTQLPPSSSQDELAPEDPVLAAIGMALVWFGWFALAAAVLLSPFVTIAVAKWRRRRLRRRAPTPLERIVGGWEEFEDAARDHGRVPGGTPTRIEVAQLVGGTQSFVLAAVADRAVFAPGEPDAEQAAQLWGSVDELRYSLGTGLSRWDRLKAAVSLRSLGGYSVSDLFKREG